MRLETRGFEPRELVGHRIGEVEAGCAFDDRVLRPLRDDDVGEDEAAAGRQRRGHAPEQIGLSGPVQMVHGERGDDEVERALGQRVLQARDA